MTGPRPKKEEIWQWLESSPHPFKQWINTIGFKNFMYERRKEAFQMQGRYDGSMSDDCKERFAAEYEFLCAFVEFLERPDTPVGG